MSLLTKKSLICLIPVDSYMKVVFVDSQSLTIKDIS